MIGQNDRDRGPALATTTDHASRRQPRAGLRRVIIDRVQPAIDGGRFAIKRCIGESVTVVADIFGDGHDLLAGVMKYRKAPAASALDRVDAEPARDARSSAPPSSPAAYAVRRPGSAPPSAGARSMPGDRMDRVEAWTEVPLTAVGNDTWSATFTVTELGEYVYTVEAWIDRFGSWLKGLIAKADAGQDVSSELLEGAELVQAAAGAAPDLRLLEISDLLRSARPQSERVTAARDPELSAQMQTCPDRTTSTVYDRELHVIVDPVRAGFSAWYEMFPRSCTSDPARSGTFAEAEARLPEIAAMGFDVLYLPPIHPIGTTFRKGRNNALAAEPGDPGSPWAIGASEGGHTAVEPGLGTLADFDRFVAAANRNGLEVALDIAFQASPDHPWVREHPAWFKHRPDGSIKYAENPPKKYQDIYPLDFDSAEWSSLWQALRDVFLFWIGHGVTIFRVDNPHTKSFRFWEWCIASIKRDHPEAIFLAEAFTRPKVMRYLAKAGYTQSYTYYTWRNTAQELRDYLTELTKTELQEYMRPNFFANTPDILHEYLQQGHRPAFEVRLVLAATLAANYGIYSGYELCENVAVRHGSEEYLDSEKYQIKIRDWNQPGHLKALISRVNQIRREQPALQQNATLAFHGVDNPALLWFSKSAPANSRSRVFVVANTDPVWTQHGFIQFPIWEHGIAPDTPYVVEDLLDGARYTWRGEWNYVKLDPAERMAHIFVVRRD